MDNIDMYYQKEYRSTVNLAKAKVVQLLKQNKNNPLRRETIEMHLIDNFTVDVDDVLKSGINDEYQFQNISDPQSQYPRFRIKTPNILNRLQLEQFLKDHQEGIKLDQLILESCYVDLKADLDDLQAKGSVMIFPLNSKDYPDIKLFISRERFFDNKHELAQFKEWFKADYKQACQDTIKLIQDKQFQNERHKLIKNNDKRRVQVVNAWIFPQGLPSEQQQKQQG